MNTFDRSLAFRMLRRWLTPAALVAGLATAGTMAFAAPAAAPVDGIRLINQGPGWHSLPLAIATANAPFDVRDQIDNVAYTFAYWASQPGVQVVKGDFNGDGLDDVALLNRSASADGQPLWNTMPVAYTNADGTVYMVNRPIGQFAQRLVEIYGEVVAGDFNGDGKADVALVQTNADLMGSLGTIPVLLSRTDGSLSYAQWPISAPGSAYNYEPQVVAGEFFKDSGGQSRTDLALIRRCASWNVPIVISGASGADVWEAPASPFSEFCPDYGTRVVAGDFNGDGLTDLAKFFGGRMLVAMASPGPGFIESSSLYGTFTQRAGTSTILTGHFDAGPTTDIAFIDRSGSSGGIAIAFGGTNGQFTVRQGLAPDFAALATAIGATPHVGDFDGNGLSDIALVQSYPGVGWATIPVAYTYTARLPGGKSETRLSIQQQTAPGFADRAKGAAVRVLVGKFGR